MYKLFLNYLFFIIYLNSLQYSGAQNALQINCNSKDDCLSMYDKGVDCIKGKCVCGDKNKSCEIRRQRNKVTVINGECTNDDDCNIDNTICQENKCKCHVDYIESTDMKKCLKASEGLNSSCTEDIQCQKVINNSKCSNTICECADGFHEAKFQCWRNVELSGNCNVNEECSYINFAVCRIHDCECDEKHVASKDGKQCLLTVVDKTGPCHEDQQCVKLYGTGASCLGEGICGCSGTYSLLNETCEKNSRLKLPCGSHEDCRNLDGNLLMDCSNGRCECKHPFLESDDICINSATSIKLTFTTIFMILSIIKLLSFM